MKIVVKIDFIYDTSNIIISYMTTFKQEQTQQQQQEQEKDDHAPFNFIYQKPNRVKWDNDVLIGPDLNKPVFSMFPKRRTLVGFYHCPQCTKQIKATDFLNEQTKKVYSESGLCYFCQQTLFDVCL